MMLLIGCVKTKNPGYTGPAVDLYDGQLWRLRRAYAERQGWPWAIVSAEHGLIEPDTVIAAYDTTIADVARERIRRCRWIEQVAAALDGVDEVEIHAGRGYVDLVRQAAPSLVISHPLAGLGLGYQKRWYLHTLGLNAGRRVR